MMDDLTEAQMDEYRANAAERQGTDEKGRPLVETMTTHDMMREMVENMRGLADMLEEIGKNPMVKAMMPKGLVR